MGQLETLLPLKPPVRKPFKIKYIFIGNRTYEVIDGFATKIECTGGK